MYIRQFKLVKSQLSHGLYSPLFIEKRIEQYERFGKIFHFGFTSITSLFPNQFPR